MKTLTAISFAALLLGSSSSVQAADVLYKMKVDGMFCQSCSVSTKNALSKVDGIKKVDVDVSAGLVSVCATPQTSFTNDQLTQIFLSKGFSFKSNTKAGSC